MSTNEQNFLDKPIDDLLQGKSAAQIASLIDQLASNVTDEQVASQIQAHERTMEDMKNYMAKAKADGVLPEDTTDEDAQDGSILIRNKTGDYNPLLEKIQGKPASATASSSSSPLTPVLIEIPISGNVTPEQVIQYAAAACLNSLENGEEPNCPLLTLIHTVGRGQLNDAVYQYLPLINTHGRTSVIYTGCDLLATYKAEENTEDIVRVLPLSVTLVTPIKNEPGKIARPKAIPAAAATAAMAAKASTSTPTNLANDEIDPMPSKERVNRFSNNGANAQNYPDGVAGYTADGRAIPIDNSGPNFDPTLPNVLGDMDYRNRLVSARKFDAKDWFYKRYDKLRWLVVAYMGPQNCNIKTTEYFMCVFGACAKKAECAKIVEHIRDPRNCYNGKIFNIGVVELGNWFQTSPPVFASDATATYSNALHREYMEAYINEQKRATVELEQRVMDEEIAARSKKNTLKQQLIEKGMNPDLAPTPAVAQAEIQVEQQKIAAKKAAQQQAIAAEKKRLEELENAKKTVVNSSSSSTATSRPAAIAQSSANIAPARVAGGMRIKQSTPSGNNNGAAKKALAGLEQL